MTVTADPRVGEMHLLPEPLFSIPTDNTQIMNITSTANGRIFMAGKDACLYELLYQVNIHHDYKRSFQIIQITCIAYQIKLFANISAEKWGDYQLLQGW